MALLFSIISFSIAFFMLLFLKTDIDIKYEKGVLITINISIFDVVLFPSKKQDAKSQEKQERKKPKKRSERTMIFGSVLKMLIHSKLRVNRVVIPQFYYSALPIPSYQSESLLLSVLFIFIAYLDTKSQKLYQSSEAYDTYSESESFVFEISASLFLFFILWEAIILMLKRRLEKTCQKQK